MQHIPLMRWELNLFDAEIDGNTLRLDLKAKQWDVERHFKYDGDYFQCRKLLVNFGYETFKKALKLGEVALEDFRLDTFVTFFNAIQKVESGAGMDGGSCPRCGTHNDFGITYCVSCGSPLDAAQVVETGGEPDPGGVVKEGTCPRCGFEKPEGALFCPGCGARLE
ncbi:MAG: zinc ribbon domain-containing protein [Candidatus Lokiarchaeota archaeon]|nr:zinc ribbon domain-containing protein [Candidatus Lokiarchaeota archaeon]